MHPVIGITSGDPAGIGLETVIKAMPTAIDSARWVLFTDRSLYERNAALFPPAFKSRWVPDLDHVEGPGSLSLLDLSGDCSDISWGRLSRPAGARALAYLQSAADAALDGKIQAIVTAPVNKYAVGDDFHGQTDFLAAHARVPRFAMAFFAPSFKVVLATIHVSLREALSRITTEGYVELIRFVDSCLTVSRSGRPRIAVAAINPHAGENGMFGREDDEILRPAVNQCVAEGIRVSGPHSADSVYYWAHTGGCDVVIAPYHDQGLIPIKLVAHGSATNVTLGLPYVRTSPDHGTAFDIAGEGKADPAGMESAMRCALSLLRL